MDADAAGCDILPHLPSNSPALCDQVKTIGLGATGSTFVSYVLGEIGIKVGWKNKVLHDHSRQVSLYNLCTLTMVRDFRDIVCSTLKRKENCMDCKPAKLTSRPGILRQAYHHNFPSTFLDELYSRYRKKEITVIRYGNIYPIECARQFFGLWVPKYFNLQSQISLNEILEIVDKYSLKVQKERVKREKSLRGKKSFSWKDSVSIPGLSGTLHLNHISNDGKNDSWKECFIMKDKVWLMRKLRKHLLRFNYSTEI